MIRFAVVAPPLQAHYHPLEHLAMELIERGHSVTFFHQPDARHLIRFAQVKFRIIGADQYPQGSLRASERLASNPNNPFTRRRRILDMAHSTAMLCQQLPQAFKDERIDAVICDQQEAAGAMVAQAMALPFVSIACALPVNREDPTIPLPVLPYPYERDERARRLYSRGAKLHDWLMKPHRQTVREQAKALGLPEREGLHECLSPLAQISQTVLEFDFPRPNLPPWFHEVGPLRRLPSEITKLPYTLDTTRPLVFASLGVLHGRRLGLFKRIAKACKALDAQLLVMHCGGLNHRQTDQLLRSGATWVTDFADQSLVLQYADALVTHAELNVVLDAIVAETPILALPIAADEPGVAARVAYSGAGIHASHRASSQTIAEHLRQLLENAWPNLESLADAMHLMGGTERAADIVEAVIPDRYKLRLVSSRQPPPSNDGDKKAGR